MGTSAESRELFLKKDVSNVHKMKSILSEMNKVMEDISVPDSKPVNGEYIYNLHKIELELDRFESCLMDSKFQQSPLDELLAQLSIIHIGRCKNAIYEILQKMQTGSGKKSIMSDISHTDLSEKTKDDSFNINAEQSAEKINEVVTSENLSTRQKDIVRNVLNGKTNSEISNELNISEQTVKNNLWKVYRKLGVKNRIQLFNKLVLI